MQIVDVVRATVRTVSDIPPGSRLGLLIIGVGFVADLVAHLAPGSDLNQAHLTSPQLSAHLVVVAGMVLVLAGVVADGIRNGRSPRRALAQGRHSDALR